MHTTLLRRTAWLAVPLVVLLPACSTTAPTAPATADVAARADRVVDGLVAGSGFSGAVVLMRDGQIVYERGVGLAHRNPDRPFTPDTPADGGSLAKTLTAAAVWELVAEGRLDLADPVQRHLPEYPYPQHTVRDLVTHRNGLPDYGVFDADFAPGQVRGTEDLLRATARRQPQPAYAPGVRIEYSNLGFDAAALVVERVTRQRVDAWWRERYFAPLGLQGMFARPARFADWPVPRTVGYRRTAAGWVPFDAYDGEGFIGASNVHASARDWARWGDAFARGRVMPATRLAAGLREAMLDSGMDNRLSLLSWYCDADRRRCHYTGAYNAFYAQLYWDRDRREVVAYVSNSTLPPWRCATLTRALVAALAGRDPEAETAPEPVRVEQAELPRRAGRYAHPALGPIVLDVVDERAFVRVGAGERVSVFQVTRQVFYVPMLDLWLAFSGPPEAGTLHVRSVFHIADARRQPAPAGTT
jgi:CubicO group peptidase (beta-lactamase class C family)